jgi:two-component sensor histidine kinase
MGWLDAVHPDDHNAALEAWDRAGLDGVLNVEYRVRRAADGAWLWHHTRSLPVRDAAGHTVEWLGTSTDIDAIRQLQARQEVLVNELQHRARNLLGVVSAVADRTVKQGGSVEAFEERLQALSRAQGLLSRSGSDTVEVSALVQAELAAYADGASGHVTISGPEVRLTARQVQNFALALHELTTNAVKYGALKGGTGQLAVTWEIALDRGERRQLALQWIESGIALRRDEAPRRGYGTELIQEALAYALQARVDYVLGDDGVRCRIEMPVS